jgi:ABC-2 type transport system ATP-binding protein
VHAVETVELTKRYGEVLALSGLSLAIEPGEIFALLGPNGAGKTTWISIVCGVAKPTTGGATVFGKDVVSDAMEARKLVGLVPQELNFDPFFTAREVLRFHMGYFGMRRDDDRIDELLAALGLTSKADVKTKALSGGMKRRLLVAKALIHRPRVAFLDEPTAGVDLPLRRELWSYIAKLREQDGTTIVLTTHYLEEAQLLADRVAVIDKGTLIANEKTSALLAQHGRKKVHFSLREPLGDAALPAVLRDAGAALEEGGRRITCHLEAGQLDQVIAAIASIETARVTDIRTVEPSLEDVFLALTGGRA